MNGPLRSALTLVSGLLLLLLQGCGEHPLKPENASARSPASVEDRATQVTTSPPAAGPELSPSPPRAATSDLWASLRGQFSLGQCQCAEVAREVQWLRANPGIFKRLGENGAPFLQFVASEITTKQLPGELVFLPMLESGYDPAVRSPHGAAGLWQFMGDTGQKFGLALTPWYDGRLDVTQSTVAALGYLQTLADRFDGDWLLALAAYNVGWGALDRTIKQHTRGATRPNVWSLPLRRETRQLVARVLAMAEIIRDPARYGITLPPVDNQPYFSRLTLQKPTDLRQFANRLGVPTKEFTRLNAGWRRAHTGPNHPAKILIPVANATAALALADTLLPSPIPALAATAVSAATTTKKHAVAEQVHRVGAGDSLWTVARHYDLHVAQLARANGMKPTTPLKVGQIIKLGPAPAQSVASPIASRALVAEHPARKTTATPRTAAKTVVAARQTTHYQVRAGDSLWTISRQFKVSVDELLTWNSLKSAQELQPGQKIVIHRAT